MTPLDFIGGTRVVGLDPSLTATGFADGSGNALTFKPNKRSGTARLIAIRDLILDVTADADLIVIEGVSFNSKSAYAHEIGGLAWIIRVALDEAGRTWVDVPPTNLKKYATGKGNAGKEEVLAAAIRRLSYDGHDNNEADALWLRTMGLDHTGTTIATVPEGHRVALAKVAWPELAGAA